MIEEEYLNFIRSLRAICMKKELVDAIHIALYIDEVTTILAKQLLMNLHLLKYLLTCIKI